MSRGEDKNATRFQCKERGPMLLQAADEAYAKSAAQCSCQVADEAYIGVRPAAAPVLPPAHEKSVLSEPGRG